LFFSPSFFHRFSHAVPHFTADAFCSPSFLSRLSLRSFTGFPM
jgi:hypothetical protein